MIKEIEEAQTPAIKEAQTETEISQCFVVVKELRPHLDEASFLQQVVRQQAEGYHLMYLKNSENIASILGYRILEYLAWGKILYIDDLATLTTARGKGHGRMLLDWAITQAKANHCNQLHLDSGYTRTEAHRLYLTHGLQLACHHFSMQIKQ